MRHWTITATLALALSVVGVWLPTHGRGQTDSGAGLYHRPKPGNQWVSVTKTKLFVVWSLPRDLTPIARVLDDPDKLAAFIGRTTIHMCAEHRRARGVDLPCKLQLVRLKSNDEYSKSASAGFTTLGKLELPATKSTAETLHKSLSLKRKQIEALFDRFDLALDRFKR